MGEITLHVTPYGRPAAELLRARITAAKGDDPLRPVTVVVPTNYVGVSTRRLLAGGALGPIATTGRGIAGLTLLTVYRLAELLGAPRLAASGRRPVSTPVISAAVRRVLADEPGMFAEVREHPSTEEALVRAYRELSELRPDSLAQLASASPRAGEVVRVRNAVRARLAPSWFEEADLMAAAEEAVVEGTPILDDFGTIIVHLPQDLTLPAAGLLRRLGTVTPIEVIAGMTGVDEADGDIHRCLARLGTAAATGAVLDVPEVTAVESVSDPEEEVRSAVERIIAAARAGVSLEQMAVLYPAPEPYARIAAEQLRAAGIAFNGRAVRPLAERLAGRWLLDLLALPDQRFSRPAVMGLLAGAPVLGAGRRRVPASAWERVSREAGVVRDRGQWQTKLARHASDSRRRADEESTADEPRTWLVDRLRANAEAADGLRAFTGGLFDRLAEAGKASTWTQLAAWCSGMLRRYLGDERVREGWPDAERAAADRVEDALDRLAGLDEVEDATDLRVFRRTLQLELDDDLGRVGAFGEGVLVGTMSAALGVDLELVVVLGLAEGIMPTRPREDSLLPDAERRTVAAELRPRAEHIGVEHRHLLAALAASRGQRVLIRTRGDLRRSIERAPSRWLPEDPAAVQIPSFARRVQTTVFPATRQEYGLRALAGMRARTRGRLRQHPFVTGDPVLGLGVELALTRGRQGFTRFDGNLADLAQHIRSPADGDATSASRLEAWLSCPHAYLMEHVLRVAPVESPEELLEIDAMERGSIVHEALELWLCEQLDQGVPASAQPWPPAARARLRELGQQGCAEAQERGVTGHPLLWHRDRRRILVDLERFCDHDDARRAELALTPVGAERPFGIPGTGTEPVSIALGDGRTVAVRGRIDRLDRAEDGMLVVTDYKTGGTRSYQGLSQDAPLGDGTKLQLGIYGLAVAAAAPAGQRVRTEYWFISTKGGFKRLGYELTDTAVEQLVGALRIAADGIGAGHFPLKPPEPGFTPFTVCRFCDPDDLGTADRYRDWERIRVADELQTYVAYIEQEAS